MEAIAIVILIILGIGFFLFKNSLEKGSRNRKNHYYGSYQNRASNASFHEESIYTLNTRKNRTSRSYDNRKKEDEEEEEEEEKKMIKKKKMDTDYVSENIEHSTQKISHYLDKYN